MKVVKTVVKVLIWIVIIALAAVATLPLWFGPVAKTAANAIVPNIVKTDFRLGHLSLNPYLARFELGDLQLSNPPGYSERYAATVGDVVFDAETLSLLTDVIHVEEIKIKDVFVSVVSSKDENGVLNFKQIQYNVVGQPTKQSAVSSRSDMQTKAPTAQTKNESPKSEKRFIIDRLEISGLMVQLGFLPIRQPLPLVMTNIGRQTGGATASEIFQQVWAEILRQAGVVGDQLKAFGGAAGHATKSVQAFGESTKELGNAVKSLGGGLKAGKAVSEGAKKTLDSLKGLW